MSLLFNAKCLRAAGLLAMLLVVSGCALITGDDGRSNPTPLTEYKPGLSARIAWKSQVGKGSGIGFVPQVVGSVVYAAAADGSLGKFDLASGSPVWVAKVDKKLSAGGGSEGETKTAVTPGGPGGALAASWRG